MTKFRPDRTIGGRTNEQRADGVLEALAVYAVKMGLVGEDLETMVGDLLCDITHLADACGYNVDYDFLDEVLDRARGHHAAESEGEPDDEEDGRRPYLEEPWDLGERIRDTFDSLRKGFAEKVEQPRNRR